MKIIHGLEKYLKEKNKSIDISIDNNIVISIDIRKSSIENSIKFNVICWILFLKKLIELNRFFNRFFNRNFNRYKVSNTNIYIIFVNRNFNKFFNRNFNKTNIDFKKSKKIIFYSEKLWIK